MLDAKVTGVSELQATFRRLPESTQRKAMRPALRKGALVVRDAVKANLAANIKDDSSGLAVKSVIAYSMKKLNGFLRYGVAIRKGVVNPRKKDKSGAPVRVGLYVSVLEYGKEGQPPRSSFRKAAAEKTQEVLAAVEKEANTRMDSAIKDAKK